MGPKDELDVHGAGGKGFLTKPTNEDVLSFFVIYIVLSLSFFSVQIKLKYY